PRPELCITTHECGFYTIKYQGCGQRVGGIELNSELCLLAGNLAPDFIPFGCHDPDCNAWIRRVGRSLSTRRATVRTRAGTRSNDSCHVPTGAIVPSHRMFLLFTMVVAAAIRRRRGITLAVGRASP